MSRCSKCGQQNKDSNQYCLKCGHKLEDLSVQTARKKKNKKNLLISISICIVAIIFIPRIPQYLEEGNYKHLLKEEERALELDDCENAIIQHKKAIEIKKDRSDSYIKLIEYYLNLNEPRIDKACYILRSVPAEVMDDKVRRLGKRIQELGQHRALITLSKGKEGKFRIGMELGEAPVPLYGLEDVFGKELLPCVYKYISEISENSIGDKVFSGYYVINDGNGYGVCDSTGKIKIPISYDYISSSTDGGVLIVEKNNKFGCVNLLGDIVIPLQYDKLNSIIYEGKGGIVAEKDEKYGFIDVDGTIILPVEYDEIEYWWKGFRIKKDDLYGYTNLKGTVILPVSYKWIGFINSDGLGVARKSENSGYDIFDKYGNTVKTLNTKGVSEISDDGVIKVSDGYKWGYMDINGKMLTDYKYEDGETMYDGVAAVMENNKWGIIDKSGEYIVPPEYEDASTSHFDYESDIAIYEIKKNDKWGAIIPGTDSIIPTEFDSVNIARFHGEERRNSIDVANGEKKGRYNLYGQLIMPVEYTVIREYENRFLWHDGEYYGISDIEGNTIAEFDYEFVRVFEGYRLNPYRERYPYNLIPYYNGDKSGFIDLDGDVFS